MSDSTGTKLGNSQKIELLIAEYQQTGEEARSRDNLIHNSYYLMAFSLGVFAVGAINLFNKGNVIGVVLLLVIASAVFAFLSVMIYTFSTYRASAWSRRRQLEEIVEKYEPGLFLIQRHVVNKRLPPGKDEPRDFTFLEGLSTKWVSYITVILSLGFILMAVVVGISGVV